MLDTTDVMEDTPSSQDAKTLVPMSLSLVAKKERILQMEVTKLEKLLGQRNEMLCGLRESHEYLLTTNGQLQERSRLRRQKLESLRTLLEADQEQDGMDKHGLCDTIGMNELEATAEKCGVLKDILIGLVDKQTVLEQQCMGLEENTSRETVSLRAKEEHLDEVRGALRLVHEDIRSAQWSFEIDEAELAEEDKRLNVVSQEAQREAATVEQISAALRTEKDSVDDLRTTWQNYREMVHEEHRQLAIANEDAKSEQRELQKLLESNGATCPADEEVLQSAKDMQSRLQHLNEEVSSTKFFKRELALRRKQEKDVLTITQSSIKAKSDQLTWLERQRIHLVNDQQEAANAKAADRDAYEALLEDHKQIIASLETQIKDTGKQLKTMERAISARNKKVTAINKKVAQKTKVLAEWKTRIDAKQEQVAKSAATQELVDGEVLSLQEELEQETRCLEHIQQLRAAQDMEFEELHSSCASMEADTQQVHKTLVAIKISFSEAQTAVKNRIDEIRDKFLSNFAVDDAEILIELLNKEIESWTTENTNEDEETIASEAKMLKQSYDNLAFDTRKEYSKVLRQKEKQYNAKLDKLKAQTAAKKAKLTTTARKPRTGEDNDSMGKFSSQERASATSHDPEASENKETMATEEAIVPETQEFDPPWLEREDSVNKKRLSKPKPTQRKANGVPKQAPKSARRQLGLNLEDESPQTDNELADLLTTAVATAKPDRPTYPQQHRLSSASASRRPRLKRRTPAQKSGKLATAMLRGTARASITPEVTLPVNIDSAALSAHSNPTADMPNPLDSPAGCEDLEASRSALRTGCVDPTKKTSETAAPPVARKPHLQQVDNRSKVNIKHRTSTKVSNRSRHTKAAKASRISLGRSQAGARTVDWSATDSFSFN